MSALVFSRCDNQNGLFAGIAQKQVNRLQSILNASAKLIHGGTRSDHVTPLLRDKLHWLRFEQRIAYKLCLTVYKALHTRSPAYIRELVAHAPRSAATARLRSAARPEAQVCVRACAGTMENAASRSLVHQHGINCLPAPAKHQHSNSFKSMLKTELFRESYSL